VHPRRLLETSTFRLALVYLALFGVSALALLGYLYWATAGVLERQITETIQAEIEGLVEQYRSEGLPRLHSVIERRSAAHPDRASVYLLTTPFGGAIAGNIDRWPRTAPDDQGWITFTIEERREGELILRRARARIFLLSGGFRLLVGREVEDRLQMQSQLRQALGWGLALTLILGLAGGFLMSRGMLRRIEAINRTTRRIMAGDLGQRIELRGSRDEFDQLAENLNAMLDQIERLLDGMRQVSDNIAHDLRTPLNRIRARIEVALLGRLDEQEARALLEHTLADAEAMIGTFNALLAIARAEAGSERAPFEPVDLAELTADLAELYGPLAEDKGLQFSSTCPPGLEIVANRQLLAQALANLLDNAIKYTPAGGKVRLEARWSPGGPVVSVDDTGPGIPEADRERVLERFVRLEAHRSTPGNGLGLSLVKAVARLHRAAISLHDNQPGLSVRLCFSGTGRTNHRPPAEVRHPAPRRDPARDPAEAEAPAAAESRSGP
jgi:signal transduction histidine kinase